MNWRIAILLTLAARGWDCSCSGQWPSVKEMWRRAPFVFSGTVELADPNIPGDQAQFQFQLVRIRVNEAFKGVSAGEIIELHQGGSDCDAKFRTGDRVVFYLYRDSKTGNWFVPWCTHALGSAEAGSDDLLFLRGLPKSAIGTRLSGTVGLDEQRPHEIHTTALPNVKVRISGPRGLRRETVTNSAGAYEVYGLRPGRYSVKIDVPAGLKQWIAYTSGSGSRAGKDLSVLLASDTGASVNFGLRADTRVSARILAADQMPPLPLPCFQLEPVQAPDEAVGFECAKFDGRFTFTKVAPGQYRILAHDTVEINSFASKSTLYYPGVRDRAHAGIVTVEAGKYVDDLEIRVPSNEARKRVSGKLLFEDGTPASQSTVTFTSSEIWILRVHLSRRGRIVHLLRSGRDEGRVRRGDEYHAAGIGAVPPVCRPAALEGHIPVHGLEHDCRLDRGGSGQPQARNAFALLHVLAASQELTSPSELSR